MKKTRVLPILAAKVVNVPKATSPVTLIVALAGRPMLKIYRGTKLQPKPCSDMDLLFIANPR